MTAGEPGAAGKVGLPLPYQDLGVGILKAADPIRMGVGFGDTGSLRTEGKA